jgi:integrase
MPACKPLYESEITQVIEILGRASNSVRNQTLFLLGIYSGYRISEILSLKVKDVKGNYLQVAGRNAETGRGTKTHEPRTVLVHPAVKSLLGQLIQGKGKDEYLFSSRETRPVYATENRKNTSKIIEQRASVISETQAYRILKKAFAEAGLDVGYATHSLRKTFALMSWEACNGNIMQVSKAIGHKSVTSTQHYLTSVLEDMDAHIEAMAPVARK